MRAVILCLLSLASLTGLVWADGGFFTSLAGESGVSADQRAIIVCDPTAGQETLVLSTRYIGSPQEFSWIIPVPALPAREQIATLPGGRTVFSESVYAHGAARVICYRRHGLRRVPGARSAWRWDGNAGRCDRCRSVSDRRNGDLPP